MTNVTVTETIVTVLVDGDTEPTVITIAGAGPQGAKGDAATIDVGTVTVVNPDQSPNVVNSGDTSDAILDFDLPRAATVSVGTVTTVDPLDPATVTDVGTDGDVVLDFEIPKGAGVAEGGTTGQILVKKTNTTYDTEWTNTPSVRRVSFATTSPPSLDAAGDVAWDDLDQALSYRTNGITVDIGQENLVYVRNPPGGSTIPKGAAVAVDGASANRLQVKPCNSVEGGDGCRTLGVAITNIPSPGFGFVSTFGLLRGFNTGAIIGGGVTEGSELFISSTPGVLSTQPQASPGRRVTVGYVVTTGAQGSIFVTVRRGLTVNELDNVLATNPPNGSVIRYDTADGRYENFTLIPITDEGTYYAITPPS
jgi:hypothetical protein